MVRLDLSGSPREEPIPVPFEMSRKGLDPGDKVILRGNFGATATDPFPQPQDVEMRFIDTRSYYVDILLIPGRLYKYEIFIVGVDDKLKRTIRNQTITVDEAGEEITGGQRASGRQRGGQPERPEGGGGAPPGRPREGDRGGGRDEGVKKMRGFVQRKLIEALDTAQSERSIGELPDIIESIYEEAGAARIKDDLRELVLEIFPALIRSRSSIAAVVRNAFPKDEPLQDFDDLKNRIEQAGILYERKVYKKLWEKPATKKLSAKKLLGMRSAEYNCVQPFADKKHVRIFRRICAYRSLFHLAPEAFQAIEQVADISSVDPNGAGERKKMLERKIRYMTPEQRATVSKKMKALEAVGGAARRAGRAAEKYPKVAGVGLDAVGIAALYAVGWPWVVLKSICENWLTQVDVSDLIEAIAGRKGSVLKRHAGNTWRKGVGGRILRTIAGLGGGIGHRAYDLIYDRLWGEYKPEGHGEGEHGHDEHGHGGEKAEEEPTAESLITEAADEALDEK